MTYERTDTINITPKLHSDKRIKAFNNRSGGPTTHIALGILVGPGIQQQPHAVRAILLSGTNKRRLSELGVDLPLCRPPPQN